MRSRPRLEPRCALATQACQELRIGARRAISTTVEVLDSTPPVVRLTLRMLDAEDLTQLAHACTEGIVELFGAQSATIVEDPQQVLSTTSVASDLVAPPVRLALKLSEAGHTPVTLHVELPPGPDIPILRGLLLDLVAVARRAWRDRRLLGEERRRAREDALTGLDNRRAIEEFLETAFVVAASTGSPLTVIAVDLDHFKAVNDAQGHPAGDDVLQLAAACFRDHLRPTDRICRFGGDEFLIVCPGLGASIAATVADRLRVAFARHQRARGTTMTMGIADLDALAPGRCGVADLLALADACLYRAKREGRDRVCQAIPGVGETA